MFEILYSRRGDKRRDARRRFARIVSYGDPRSSLRYSEFYVVVWGTGVATLGVRFFSVISNGVFYVGLPQTELKLRTLSRSFDLSNISSWSQGISMPSLVQIGVSFLAL
jgi:hypothetical protein